MGNQELYDSLSLCIDLGAVRQMVKDVFSGCKRMQRHAGCQSCDLINLALKMGMVMDAMASAFEVWQGE